jgi:hypothetical protein
VLGRDALVEGGELGIMAAGQLSQVGVRDLPVTHHTRHAHLPKRHVIGPKLVARMGLEVLDQADRVGCAGSFPDGEAHQRRLGDWAGGVRLID